MSKLTIVCNAGRYHYLELVPLPNYRCYDEKLKIQLKDKSLSYGVSSLFIVALS